MNQRQIQYLDYLCLSDKDKLAYPSPTITVFWTDVGEMSNLQKQKWLPTLRDQLNRGGKITVNTLVFKYEQKGIGRSFGPQDAEKLARELFQKWKPASYPEYQQQIVNAIKKPSFSPFLVVLDGGINVVFSTFEVIAVLKEFLLTQALVDSIPEFDVSHPRLSDDDLHRHKAELMNITRRFLNDEEIKVLLKSRLLDRKGFKKLKYKGKEYALAILLGKDHPEQEPIINCEILCPFVAVDYLPGEISFAGRVLGKVCHTGGDEFRILPIAMCEVNLFAIT
jgi:hypothetical protein